MPERCYRLLLVATHPVQYASPVFREMARNPRLDIEVAYCSMHGAEAAVDKDFGVEVKWDVPLLDGYPWKQVPNRALRPGLERFFGLLNPGLWRTIRNGRYDAVIIYTGYRYASFWIALAAAKITGTKFMFGTDATSIAAREGSRLKSWLKPRILSFVFRRADATFGASVAGKEYLKSLGVPVDRIGIVPLVVDNDWWLARSGVTDRAAVRANWGVPFNALVVMFCAKLQPWKRPMDLLRAFAAAAVAGSHLVYVGDGPLANELSQEAGQLGIADCVHFLGFQNQSQLPAVYSSGDLFVLPSKYDPCPAVVCEAMLCGLPVLLSDEILGRREQIDDGETGLIFPCGDVNALAEVLRRSLADPVRLAAMGQAACREMDSFSPVTNVKAFLELLDATFENPRTVEHSSSK